MSADNRKQVQLDLTEKLYQAIANLSFDEVEWLCEKIRSIHQTSTMNETLADLDAIDTDDNEPEYLDFDAIFAEW